MQWQSNGGRYDAALLYPIYSVCCRFRLYDEPKEFVFHRPWFALAGVFVSYGFLEGFYMLITEEMINVAMSTYQDASANQKNVISMSMESFRHMNEI